MEIIKRFNEASFTLHLSYMRGVREVVISPGSRSTPLALAFEAHQILKHGCTPMSEVQRFCSWLIKGSERPVAILCTSGTAAAIIRQQLLKAKLVEFH